MATNQTFHADLRGGMRYAVELSPSHGDVDFNVYVHDPAGRLVAEDTRPVAGAACEFDVPDAGRYAVTVELARGSAGFSVNIAGEPLARPEPRDLQATSSAVTALSSEEAAQIVEAHNRWRARYGVVPLQWSDSLAAVAQDWANQLRDRGMRMRHRSPNEHGENLYWCSGRPATPSSVVDAWGDEVALYDEARNTWWPDAGHFSQVVWHSTTHVGAGVARAGGQELWVCNYSPRGNWTGQRPYPV